ncbi:UV-stimulated scaffold protein A-like [Pseudoliparis swirei]|uniref:UV-stimulated scaffold protein A-like n=1 Tax=Pseudoliparis swirei TaxID=2059687 RepID=UPI0024BED4E2|nr:UV-stimulated scaffold protein A-like [Pseudoliparis swirei]XP_056295533.1 UV-stimulated scaffold protein A-like [Pseudoliparis swirei]
MVMELPQRDRLSELVEQLTTSGEPQLNQDRMKEIKKICKVSNDCIDHVYHSVIAQLNQEHAEVRLSAFQIASELFSRSHHFRMLLVDNFQELISQAGLDLDLDLVMDASHEERVHQYSKVSLQVDLLEKGWCNLVPQLLESTEHDYREKALRALLAMAPMCLDQYRSDSSLLGSLLYLRDQYQEMVQSEMIVGEENSYFEEIVELINALQVQIK